MKALLCTKHGSLSKLVVGVAPTPKPDDDEVLIAIEAAQFGFVDTLMVADKHQMHHPVPFSPGMGVVGRVVLIGKDVLGFDIGMRVGALMGDGGLAEHATAPAYETFPLPEDCDSTVTAAVLMSALTADLSLVERAHLNAGETVLVGGAGGAVGLCTVQLAKAANARVIAAASSADRCEIAISAGADAAVVYGEDFRERVRAVNGGRDVDIVVDPVGGAFAEGAVNTLGWCGRYVVVGFAGGMPPPFAANRLLIKNRAAIGMVLGYYRWHRSDLLAASAMRVLSAISAKKLSPALHVVTSFDAVPGVLEQIASRSFTGIAVLRIDMAGGRK